MNTASRMESTGAPWRIHISEDTRLKLEATGGFKIDFRFEQGASLKKCIKSHYMCFRSSNDFGNATAFLGAIRILKERER